MEDDWRLSVWNKEKKAGWGWVLFHLLVAQEIGCFLPAGFHGGNGTYSIGLR